MNAESLFRDVGLAKFVAEHLHRLPIALAGSVEDFKALGSWQALDEILGSGEPDMLVVRNGERRGDARPVNEAQARTLSDDGYTIVVRHAERNHAGLSELAGWFERTFYGPVDVQMFVTPPGQAGFSWHYDAEDVFILQTAGSKEYRLRKNTVNPWPLEETLPEDMRYEREIMPLMTVSLAAGDLLYVPCGYWHKADASKSTEAAISLAVGVMSRTGVDVFDFLRRRVVDSLLWRQRLPLVGEAASKSAEDIEAEYRELFERYGADIVRALNDPRFVSAFMAERERGARRRDGAG
ncbi:MAG TPA: cupin domain-containing protein [Lacipirellula sp.]